MVAIIAGQDRAGQASSSKIAPTRRVIAASFGDPVKRLIGETERRAEVVGIFSVMRRRAQRGLKVSLEPKPVIAREPGSCVLGR
ncbi:hypothetical protein [Rhodoblastus sp.]|uniref:hypothetical protein n=1 Tax=Rhodoblastus sp. TaxID=1962975 RepID=UPI002636169A|nr:hypothetical protein [Rhodoblastus sp.]